MSGRFQETSEEVEVRREDQQKINRFGVIHKRLEELGAEATAFKQQLEYLEDAEQEGMFKKEKRIAIITINI